MIMTRMGGRVDGSGLRKGPWSAQEDEILINFVKQNGPTRWSSIRSNGLLPRTGKSCRLRWVNKLRPNLKVGCKFTAEEERTVVELQAKFGNKWAAIASHLEGRTDNDVKNFWSSRQKRLARLLHSSANPYTKPQKQSKHKSTALIPQIPHANSQEPESSSCTSQTTDPLSHYHHPDSLYRTSDSEPINAVPLTYSSPTLSIPQNSVLETPQQDLSWLSQLPNRTPLSQSFPTQTYTPILPGLQIKDTTVSHVFVEPSSCHDLFPCILNDPDHHLLANATGIVIEEPFFRGLMEGSSSRSKSCFKSEFMANPDGFFDDFPNDVFDCLDPLPNSLAYLD